MVAVPFETGHDAVLSFVEEEGLLKAEVADEWKRRRDKHACEVREWEAARNQVWLSASFDDL